MGRLVVDRLGSRLFFSQLEVDIAAVFVVSSLGTDQVHTNRVPGVGEVFDFELTLGFVEKKRLG